MPSFIRLGKKLRTMIPPIRPPRELPLLIPGVAVAGSTPREALLFGPRPTSPPLYSPISVLSAREPIGVKPNQGDMTLNHRCQHAFIGE